MGNSISSQSTPLINLEMCLKEIKEIKILEKVKINRFLKTLLGKFKENENDKDQKAVIKVYSYSVSDVQIIQNSIQNLLNVAELFRKCSFISIYSHIFMTEKICAAVRPYFHQNLFDRLSCRPYLQESEKLFILYQIMCALMFIHQYFGHGDLKLENILLTSWGYVSITDLSIFIKPTIIHEDSFVSEFNYFFDTSGRKTCYIAPERIKSSLLGSIFYLDSTSTITEESVINFKDNSSSPMLKNITLLPSHDIFSLGCLIFQLFTDNKVLLISSEYMSLYKETKVSNQIDKSGEKSINFLQRLHTFVRNNITNTIICDMILSMISILPEDRRYIDEYLKTPNLFPDNFCFVLSIANKLVDSNDQSPEYFIYVIKKSLPELISNLKSKDSSYIYHSSDPGICFALNVIASALPKLTLKSFKIDFFELCLEISLYVSSDIVLETILSHVIYMSNDSDEEIRKVIPLYVSNILQNVKNVHNDHFDSNYFTDYILQYFITLQSDSSVMVRLYGAKYFPLLLKETFRLHIYCLNESTRNAHDLNQDERTVSLESELESIYNIAFSINISFLKDNSFVVKSYYVQESFIQVLTILEGIFPFNISSRDTLLSHFISFINLKESSILRQNFYNILPKVIRIIGNSYSSIIPIFQEEFIDTNEWIIVSYLKCLSSIQKTFPLINEVLLSQILHYLLNPNPLIRHYMIKLIKTIYISNDNLTIYEKYVHLLRPFLDNHSLLSIFLEDPFNLVNILISPIPYTVYELIKNKLISFKFLLFLANNSDAISNDSISPRTDCLDFLEIHDDSILFCFNLLKKNGFHSRQDLLKLLRMRKYLANLIKSKFALESSGSFNESKKSGYYNLNEDYIKKSKILDLSINFNPNEESSFDHIPLINSLYNNFSSVNNAFLKHIESMLSQAQSDFKSIFKQHRKNLKIYKYAHSYCTNYKNLSLNYYPQKAYKIICNFKPHQSSVNRLGFIRQSPIFTTASDDCTVKLFDCNNLDSSQLKSDFNPLLVYNQMSGRVNLVKNLNTQYFSDSMIRIACSSSDFADIHVVDIKDVTVDSKRRPFYRCLVNMNEDGMVVDLTANNIYSEPFILAATLFGSVLGYDVRDKTKLPNIRFRSTSNGYFSALECDPFGCWVTAGDSEGCLHLWDIRLPSLPLKAIKTSNHSMFSRLCVSPLSHSKLICGFTDSKHLLSFVNLETFEEEAIFSSSKQTSTTSCYPLIVDNSLVVYFSSMDGNIRKWNLSRPSKSSIVIPSLNFVNDYENFEYSTRITSINGPIETYENLEPDPININNTKTVYDGSISTYCTDLFYNPILKLLVLGMIDGTVRIYK